MSPVVDATSQASEEARADSIDVALGAVRAGQVVVLPTDTVYGIGCDAFSPEAVAAVLDAKGRGRDMPPPVLVPDQRTVDGLAREVPPWARELIDQLWPGPLTLVLHAQPSLHWDLGETDGTVALRMPDDEVALQLLRVTGPMAVTSANRTGQPAATSVIEAAAQLGSAVEVYLDGGPRVDVQPSTILDCTGDAPVLLREGALPISEIRELLGDVTLRRDGEPSADTDEPTDSEPTADDPDSDDEQWQDQPDTETPGTETPDTETPDGQTPDTETPGSEHPDTEDTAR
ncbi:hypothetical protein GCM10027055_15880 [Janibacter alkaliphilus]|uniref:L-threonylcarbamoyladenylate synthase n=1 Tax=Janibacter alkaliphilus TaxID=1069963 RepID=A0A852XG84_9MICO|nr:L-threonylcarbamoyladenylate synthase [Janibacter alkaliphilus]NYG37421.1 tRNA threonylcarbamoyl adenosine modification protein (Sua5/YciO/YrdC/YwlC family) [Janibacter alkaliphilus]